MPVADSKNSCALRRTEAPSIEITSAFVRRPNVFGKADECISRLQSLTRQQIYFFSILDQNRPQSGQKPFTPSSSLERIELTMSSHGTAPETAERIQFPHGKKHNLKKNR